MQEQLMFSWEEPHANLSQSPACELEFQTLVEGWHSGFLKLLETHALAGWSGRMSPVSCRRMQDGTLVPSSGGWQNSGMVSHTECWTLSTSEWPSDAVVCLLLHALETGEVLQRYYLTAKACKGILYRAKKRGRKLPAALIQALEEVIGRQK